MIRNTTIDIAKGIGILAVVVGHNWLVLHNKGELFRIVFSFHVPLFFFLSGLFIKSETKLGVVLRYKILSLLKPYFVVLISLYLAKSIVLMFRNWKLESFDFEKIANIFYGTGSTIDWIPLWFLPHLFISSIFSLLFLKLTQLWSSSHIWLTTTAMLFMGAFFIDAFWITPLNIKGGFYIPSLQGLPWSVDLVFVTSSMMLYGYLLKDKVFSFEFDYISFAIAVLAFFGLHFLFDVTMDLNRRIYGDFLVSSIQALTGIYIVLSLSSLISKNCLLKRVFSYIGAGTLFILLFHGYVQGVTFGILTDRLTVNSYVASGMSFILAVLLPLLILEITKRISLLRLLLLPDNNRPAVRGAT